MRFDLGWPLDLLDGVDGAMSGPITSGGNGAISTVFVRVVGLEGGERRDDGEGSEGVEVVAGEESSAFVGEVKSIVLLTLWLDDGLRAS